MCTAMTLQTAGGHTLFGRTMDFSYLLDPELYVCSAGYKRLNFLKTHRLKTKYSFMGIGQDINSITLGDGVNEMGFSAAALYFPDFAHYDSFPTDDDSKIPIVATELVYFLLGQCSCVEHALSVLNTIQIIGEEDAITNAIAPLHWIIADQSGKCMVIEKMADGLHVIDNPIGVFTNSPDFTWHMTNLRSYMGVSPTQNTESTWGNVTLSPLGEGSGTLGLPGDYTSPSRFVRTAYNKCHALLPASEEAAVTLCFHIMDNVSIPRGIVVTDRQTPDYTQYTAFINLTFKEYFIRAHSSGQIATVKLEDKCCSNTQMVSVGKLIKPVTFSDF